MNRQLPLLLLTALFVFSGAWRIVEAGTDDGWAAICVGCVLLGVWLAVDLHDRWHPSVDLTVAPAIRARRVDPD